MFKNKISKILTFSMILVIILTQILTPTYAFASDKVNSKAKEVTQNNLNNNENSYEDSEINSEAETSNGITTLPKIALETDKNISSDSSLPDTIGENKIERISLQWITKDNDSDEDCLNNVYKDNKTKSISFSIIYALSGKGNYDIGKLNIVLPKTIFKNRNGEKIGDIEFAIPKLPDRNDNFAYQETEDSYIITNTKKISAATSGGIECRIYNLTPSEIKDIATPYISEPIFANLEIETNKGTIGKKSNILKSTIDTDTKIYEAHLTHDNYETVKSKFPNSWDLSLKPENPDNYYYVEYNTYANSKANQYFDVDLDINVRNSEDSKNAIILGYRNNKNGEVTKGDGSGNLSVNIEKNNYVDDGSNFVGEIYVAYPIQDFAYNREYNLGSSVQFTMRGVDDKKVTKAKTEDLVLFKPAHIDRPEGLFYVEKQGTGDEITTSFNKYDLEGIYDLALNELRDGKSVDTSFDIETRAWAPLHTLKKDGDFRKISDYGQSTYKLITEDFKTTFNYKDRELTSDDFSIKALDLAKKPLAENVSSFLDGNTFTNKLTGNEFTTSKKIRKIFNFSLADDRDIPITNIFGKVNNSDTWIKLGSVDYTNGIAIINPENGSTVDGTKLVFPENITDFKTEVDTKIVHYVHDIKAIFTIKPSENILKEVNSKYGNNKLSMTRFTNKIKLRVESEEQGSGFVNEYTANNILTDFSYGIKPEKKLINYSNDKEHKRIDLEYEIASKIQTNITTKKALKTVKEKGYIKDQKEGVFYELLPKGVNPITDSIKPVRKGDSITSVKAYENYQNSGRIMLEIHLKETPDYKYEYRDENSILGMKGYYDRPAVRFKAYYTWTNLRIYSPILSCIMAYKSTEKVGNTEGLESETNVFSNKNKFTEEAFETEEEKNIFNSLGEGNYVYARDYSEVDVLTSYSTTLLKQVDVNNEGLYNDGLDNILSKNVYENGKYSYSISIKNSDVHASKDIVFYDNLEKYKPQKDSDDYGDIQWRGIFDNVNTDSLKKLGVEAVIYYSTKDNLVLDDENNRKDNDLTNTDIWSKTMPKDKSSIKAIAIDARKTVKNDDFILDKNQSIDLIINMRAPKVSDKRYYDKVLEKNQKEVGFVGGAHAYNNAVMTCRHISLDNGNITDNLLIRNDYTKVGFKPYNISVKKTFDDENNRDGVREDKAIIELVGNGTPTGKKLTLSEKNNWEGTFSELPYLDKEGNVISYTFREINNQKYTLKVNRDNNSTDNKYNLVNFHSPEKINIQGEKHWVDKTEEKRPQSILITLKADGEEIDNREVKPDSEGKWKYEFDNLYKYRDGGKKIKYTVEEKNYITGYISEVKDFDIVNTYHPYANVIVKKEVIDQTEKAKELNPDFTFKFNLTDSEGNLIFKEYEYTTNLGRRGKIFSGNEFKLKKDEQMTIKNVDSETSVEVKEIKKPSGYENVESPPKKLIQAGKDVELKFINKYVTFGRTTLESTKKLVGRKLLNKEFRFDLLLDDKEIDSTYNDKNGKVIFNNLEYSNKDVGKTYTYKIKEYNNNHAGITYTNEISQVDVKVSDDGKGSISVEKNYADKNFVFTNKYNATGKVNLKAWKQIKGDYNKLGKYDFELYDDKNNVVATGTNDENGTINFTDLVYSEKDAGKTFIYTAKERQGKDDSIIYDKSTITYKVEVIDNLDGTLSFNTSVVDNKIDDKNNDSTTPLFVNEYKNGKLTVRKNVLNGDTNKEFRFKIKFKGENIPNGKFDLNKKNNISSLNKVKKFLTDIFKPKEAHAAERYAPEGEVIHSGYLSGDVKYEIYENGHMVISSIGNTGTLPKFSGYDNEFGYRKYKDKIKSISFSGDVKANVISDDLFRDLDKVVSIDTTNLDTKRTTSMNCMFRDCKSLKELDLSKFKTSEVTNMSYMFNDCKSLKELDVSKFDTSKVTNMGAMFGCESLEKLDVSNFDTSKVTNMWSMFFGCQSLKELDLSKFDTSKVTDMSSMFNGCESLKELDLSKFDTSKVTDMSYMFNCCQSLEKLDVSKFDTSKVTTMGAMFAGCESLEKLDVSKFDTSKVTDMGYMFKGCGSLENLDVSKFDTSEVTDMCFMFGGCQSLQKLDVSKFDTSEVTNMSYMFNSCESLKELDLSKFNTSKVTNMHHMFVDCKLLEKLNLSKFKTSEVTDMQAMFAGCESLEKLDVSNFDTSKVTNMSYMFDGCKLLKELDLRKFDTSKVIDMSNMFSDCQSLITFALPNLESEVSWEIFNSLPKSLKKLDVSKVNFSSSEDIDLQNLDSLEEVVVPSKLMLRDKKYFPVKLSGTFITDDGVVFAPDKDIFSFAKTTLTKKGLYYTIKFETDTGEKFAPIRLKKDEEKKLPTPKIKKPGYKFLGWSTTQNKENIVTDIKTLTHADKNDITLYAVWKKLETNINIKDGEAEFMLSADEQITLDNLPAGISYEIYEEQEEGWVLVKEENTNGTIEPNKETIATFTNDYRPQSTQAKVQAKKLLNSTPAKGFEFELLKEGQVIDKATSLADGSINFNTLTFDTAGTFNYQIREVKGNDPNINYDSAIKNVKIEVTDNGRGKKEAKVTYTDTPTFNNTTKLGKLEIKKEVTGTTDNSKDFTFEILINGKKQNITLKNGESKTIDSIPYGSSYEVKEINLPKGYVTAEIENASGVISSSEITVLAKNKYNPIGNVQIKARKVLKNKDLSNGEFVFELLDSNDNVLDTAKNDRDGNIYFNSLEIKEAKNAKYKIREVQGNEKDIVYDNHEEIVNVTVTDDGEGNLTAREQYDDDGAIFTNKYNVEKIPKIENETNFTITKKLEGTSTDKEFEVKVDIKKDDKNIENVFSYTSNLDSKEHEFVSGEKVKIKGNEILTFKKVPLGAKVTLTEDSYPGYTVKEDSILEKVLEDKENNLKITNVYHANGKLELKAKKELLGGNIEDYNFDFLLMNNGDVLSKVKNDENGNIDFNSIKFNEKDIGKTYEYLVIEDTGHNSNINYDKTEYKFTVKIEDNGDGTLNLIKKGDYKNIIFKNSIKPILPITGTRKGIGILIGLFSLLLITFVRKKFNLIKLIKREKM